LKEKEKDVRDHHNNLSWEECKMRKTLSTARTRERVAPKDLLSENESPHLLVFEPLQRRDKELTR
ncbi:hypothetical protein QML37_30645, partial [Klebsiella pneumoniae]|uniref:hypothetical protein n=1 Tax=Klebsiella pneumoniae TaxID=573 RepID=UPI003A800BE4